MGYSLPVRRPFKSTESQASQGVASSTFCQRQTDLASSAWPVERFQLARAPHDSPEQGEAALWQHLCCTTNWPSYGREPPKRAWLFSITQAVPPFESCTLLNLIG
ncbi:hypothetical protein CSKR_202492 [Clonorchis sinensis]|uniref:Uncharacterized protein n=1 Tax=Clonorchis sinensis TaxID=79923 RepID=A0A8T1MWI0_CLOSI|nr:hypothetical protein CSKR_202492 [Clonorchis sinensis]